MHDKAEQFIQTVMTALNQEQLLLPSLPEIALKVRKECEKEDSSAEHIAELLLNDASLSVKLLQVANSSFYKINVETSDIKMAITRLGLHQVKSLVISLAMKQLYQASTDILRERFRELWLSSVKTATLCRMLCSHINHLDKEQAMLAGLTHSIGALPVLLMAESDEELLNNAQALITVTQQAQGKIGECIFRKWNFPEYMIQMANECYDFKRSHEGPADYLDVLQVALVEGSIYTGLECPDDWSEIPAFKKLGINTDVNFLDIEDNKLTFEETEALLK
ncbi:MAG: HDOD domain-containing protein [Gammaproteobacteria bacterium]|nr:HDOD domain-containing protein [Gammaproteobacteria bacterium]